MSTPHGVFLNKKSHLSGGWFFISRRVCLWRLVLLALGDEFAAAVFTDAGIGHDKLGAVWAFDVGVLNFHVQISPQINGPVNSQNVVDNTTKR